MVIGVFYEYPNKHSSNRDFSWETTQMRTNALRNTKLSPYKNLLFRVFYNGSYLVSEISTAIIMAALLVKAGMAEPLVFERVVIICVLAAMWIVVFVIVIKLTFVNGFTMKSKKKDLCNMRKRH